MQPASCGMILQTLDAPNNVCSVVFDRALGGELEKTFHTFPGVVLINLYASNGTSNAVSANKRQRIRGVMHKK